jgi:hydrogenase maturation protein HypF
MTERLKIHIKGAVQGVGFRPFVYRLAKDLHCAGYVLNSASGVTIEAEGEKPDLDKFLLRLTEEKPARAVIFSLEHSFLDPVGFSEFTIKKSEREESLSAAVLPDIAVCEDCLKEMYDPADRRYLYPFINCTNCGPRFSIIEALPYDRINTSMKIFEMCPQCRGEYLNPENRRFHAQPIACPDCGPQISLWDANGKTDVTGTDALEKTVTEIRNDKIIALKGLGGFQLLVDARKPAAVQRLRDRKHREEKPFALMFPTLESVKMVCEVSVFEERLLRSPEAPIVLLKRKSVITAESPAICPEVAPDNPYLGVMLPYTPLHHLLLRFLKAPIVATSGNLAEEPMSINEEEAFSKLGEITDFFLVHDRPIVRHVDDSIVRVISGRELVLRRARGYAPLPIRIKKPVEEGVNDDTTVLAVGGHLKNTVALQKGLSVFISQHIGDLSTHESISSFERVIRDFKQLYQINPQQTLCDLHPDYISSKLAKEWDPTCLEVQHHEAHIASCRLENQIEGPALGVSWDGTGYGSDGTIWGGEFFISEDESLRHFGQMRQFQLPGGDEAVREPRRSALGLLFEIAGVDLFREYPMIKDWFTETELSLLQQMLERQVNCPRTSSVGRIFDAVAALLNIYPKISYEGQAAMALEYMSDTAESGHYHFKLTGEAPVRVDWAPMLHEILRDLQNRVSPARIAMRFHRTLSRVILAMTRRAEIGKVIMSGGCFQNAILLETSIDLLRESDVRPYWHQRVPPNDGGIALGQIAVAQMQAGPEILSENCKKREKLNIST